MPTEDKERLLKEKGKYESTTEKEDKITLLSENVGRLDPVGKVKDKEIPNVNIFETTNSKVLDTINPVYVRNGWFDKKIKIVKFSIGDLETTNNVVLSFSAPTRKGILSIKLNGELIYEYDINSINVEPIKLKKESLQKENELEFSVSGVGAKFWTTNEYSLDNMKIIGDITDLSRQESRNTFALTDTEYQNLEKAELRFTPYCISTAEAGILTAFINNRDIYSAVPACNERAPPLEIPQSALSAGQNKVIFKTSKGSYSIEQIKLTFKQKDIPKAVYYFEANSTTLDDIKNNEFNAFIRIEFVDDQDNKKADINLNDHLTRIDQKKKDYEKNINEWLEEGNNFIEITPKTTLDIVELKVVLEEK